MPSSLTRVLPFVSGFSPRPPASVSGTGTIRIYLAAFLASVNSLASLLDFGPHHTSACRNAYFTTFQPRCLHRVDHHPARVILLCHCIVPNGGAGIYTCCPSPTTSVLGLGPDLPWVDEPSPGNLGLSTGMFLACLSLLIPAFSLLYSPPCLSIRLLPVHYAPLPRLSAPIASVSRLSPGHFRRTITRPVSYYALFK